jgi:hypothetical protein
MFVFYLFVFLLNFGTDHGSGLQLSPLDGASNLHLEEHARFAYCNHSKIVEVVEDVFPDLIDDNTSAGNEDDNNSNGKDFSAKNSCQNSSPPDLSDLFVFRHRLISSHSLGTAAPIYLRNRVMRI